MYQTPTKPRLSTSTPIKRAPSLAKTIEKHRPQGARPSSSTLSTSSSLSQSKRNGGMTLIQQLASVDGIQPDIEEPEGVFTNQSVIINNVKGTETIDWTVELTAAQYIRQLAQKHAHYLVKYLASCIRFLIKMQTSPRPSVVRPALQACIDLFESETLQPGLKSLVVNQKLLHVMTLVSGRTGTTNDSLIDQSLFAVCCVVAHRGVRVLCEQLVVKGDRYYSNRLFSAGGLLTCLNYIPDTAKHKQKLDDVSFVLQTIAGSTDAVGIMREIYAETLARLVVVAGEEGEEAQTQQSPESLAKLDQIWQNNVVNDTNYVRLDANSNNNMNPTEQMQTDNNVATNNTDNMSSTEIYSNEDADSLTFRNAFDRKIIYKKQKKVVVVEEALHADDNVQDVSNQSVETPRKSKNVVSADMLIQSPPNVARVILNSDAVVTADEPSQQEEFPERELTPLKQDDEELISHLDLPPSPSMPTTARHVSPQWLSLHRPVTHTFPHQPSQPQLPTHTNLHSNSHTNSNSQLPISQQSIAASQEGSAVTVKDISDIFDQCASLVSLKPEYSLMQGNKLLQMYNDSEKRRAQRSKHISKHS